MNAPSANTPSTKPDLPPVAEFMAPLLRVLTRHAEGCSPQTAYEEVAAKMELTEAQRELHLRNLPHRLYKMRIGWAQSRLRKAGLVALGPRGVWMLTEAGWAAAKADGAEAAIRRFLEGDGSWPRAAHLEAESLEERLDALIEEWNANVADQLLGLVTATTPEFFEHLVLDLLRALGYGTRPDDVRHTGASGDAGIDGVIHLDRLGLQKVYVQAKRWQPGSHVGRPEVQAFVGALAGRRANLGVFITTSRFTREARAYAARASDSVVLVDGRELATLMIERGVGVSMVRDVRLVRIDRDYFEGE